MHTCMEHLSDMAEMAAGNEAPKTELASQDVLKWLATALGLLSPVFYLNGRAFRYGYLGYLHLEPSMFPTDVPDTLTYAAFAWMGGLTSVLDAVKKTVVAHWIAVGVMPVAALALFAAAVHFIGAWARRRRASTAGEDAGTRKLHPAARRAALAVFKIYFSFYATYTLLLVIAAALLLFVAPFAKVGESAATRDAEMGFKFAPSIAIADPQGTPQVMRIVQCSTQFCALYADHAVVTVPAAAIKWASSPRIGAEKGQTREQTEAAP